MPDAHLKVFRGDPSTEGHYEDFDVPVEEGMVVLDALHWIQGHEAPDLAVRWNCKAAKCGSCSAEVDGRPRLTCKTRLSDFDLDETITVEPMRAFPLDPRPRHGRVVELRGQQDDPAVHPARGTCRRRTGAGSSRTSSGSRNTASASSASCARTSATSCATTRPRSRSWGRGTWSGPPASRCIPIDQADRREYLKDSGGIGYCNITKCCTEVCPEHIKITDNAIIPLKERVADAVLRPDPVFWRALRGGGGDRGERVELPVLQGTPTDRRAGGRGPTGRGARLTNGASPPVTHRVRHPHRRRGPRQSRSGLAWRRALRPRPPRRPRSARRAGRVDLGVPRRADQQRRRVHRHAARARARPGARGARRSTCCSIRS